MATLALNLLKHSLDGPVANAAVVSIRQIADAAGDLPETPFEAMVPIPAGPIPPVLVEVPEGRFALTARMPSGATDRRSVRTTADQVETITFDTGHSAREWLSWSTLAGAVPVATSFESRGVLARGRQRSIGLFPLEDLLERRFSVFATAEPPWAPPLHRGVTAGRGFVGFDRIDPRPGPPIHLSATSAEASVFCWNVIERGSYPRDADPERHGRPFAVVEYLDGMSLAMLPLPWPYRLADAMRTSAADGAQQYAPVDLLVDRALEPNRALRLTLREPEFVALLSYLGAGRMTEAAAALGGPSIDAHVTRLIREKIDNPLAAAGAAYVGLATSGDEALRDRWRPWLRNLMNWFGDLPDGAILYARDRIERGRTREDLMDAKAALKTAYHRGIPLYAAGFQHLLSGLQLFADDEGDEFFDPEARGMHQQVAQMAARVDPSQPFTVLTFRQGI